MEKSGQWSRWIKESRWQTGIVLLLLWVVSLWNQPRLQFFVTPFLALVVTVGVDLLIVRLRFKKWLFSPSSLVTGCIIGLVVDPLSPWFVVLSAALFASFSKQFIGVGRKQHMFNPAAFGIFVTAALFDRPVAWWAASWGWMPLVIIFFGMAPILLGLRRLWMPVTFLLFYFLNALLFSSPEATLRLTVDGTVFFFAFVMLPEPMTSASYGLWRYGWGVLVGLLVFFQSFLRVSIADPLLLSLLVANCMWFFAKRRVRLSTDTVSHIVPHS